MLSTTKKRFFSLKNKNFRLTYELQYMLADSRILADRRIDSLNNGARQLGNMEGDI